jgi:hypothetical protein
MTSTEIYATATLAVILSPVVVAFLVANTPNRKIMGYNGGK